MAEFPLLDFRIEAAGKDMGSMFNCVPGYVFTLELVTVFPVSRVSNRVQGRPEWKNSGARTKWEGALSVREMEPIWCVRVKSAHRQEIKKAGRWQFTKPGLR
ncbi:hypothetical protein [Microbulbifer hydrolyticus]|uniref:Uncharacterized protein n=1 Tax=Microbulbifer hydrolyticus TaxID=48074 RepID=A0A6P1TAJ1_9GAMM|nr:hypothetical protein [Microbulbifer hydrolyticus]MBB5213139.1 hypothetical protein [Microbulbifer hydrolyticus]QHQ38656.1 hypothetical protein GTQ55_06400 [Microbulbifer hydrolyticus]